jgi:hypothetical protein
MLHEIAYLVGSSSMHAVVYDLLPTDLVFPALYCMQLRASPWVTWRLGQLLCLSDTGPSEFSVLDHTLARTVYCLYACVIRKLDEHHQGVPVSA